MDTPQPFDKRRFEAPTALSENGLWKLVQLYTEAQHELITQLDQERGKSAKLEAMVKDLSEEVERLKKEILHTGRPVGFGWAHTKDGG